jgi:CDP-2,3-bis-(O-geranylgeranyl)-sn-glycerol synthase
LDIFGLLSIFAVYVGTMYFANAAPIVLHGTISLDLGKSIFGQRILGDGKTIIGTFAGILVGTAAGALLFFIIPLASTITNYFQLIVLLSVGAIFGDIVKSFFKRRLKIKSGQQWAIADQLDFVLGGLLLSSLVRIPEIELVVLILVITIFAHSAFNFIAFKLKLKKVPW